MKENVEYPVCPDCGRQYFVTETILPNGELGCECKLSQQTRIYRAVVARGYRKGWTAQQFAARQVAKLTEELGELAGHIHQFGFADSAFEWPLRHTANQARREFDDLLAWETAAIESPQDAMSELADIIVVACCLAEALGEYDYDSMGDLMEMALEKASEDIDRGVRSWDPEE